MEHEKKQRAEENAKAEQKAAISRCIHAALATDASALQVQSW